MPKSTLSSIGSKPDKPRDDFPLYAHASGRWAKKVRGKTYFFGKWDDPQGALEKWLDQKDDLLAGRKPRPKRDGLKLLDAVNAYLTKKKQQVLAGEITQRSFERYYQNGEFLLSVLDKTIFVEDLRPEDFLPVRATMAEKWGAVALGNEIQYVKSVFKYAFENGLIDRPVRFGSNFDKPSKKTMRKIRIEKGKRLFAPAEILNALTKASVNVRAFILLAANSGMGPTDIAEIKVSLIDGSGWLEKPRSKTWIDRRIPLWPETLKALRDVLKHRREPRDQADAELLFIAPKGGNYIGCRKGHAVYGATKKVFPVERTFYDLRHTFETIASQTKDQAAVSAIMGHAPAANDMSSVYREEVGDDRLRAVVDHVHAWLFPAKGIRKRGQGK
ncbi:MAG: tyrosine-type recombinase/integrase [Pirellulaceae bacterium]